MATKPNPKDSMKSTWLQGDKSTWTYAHHTVASTRFPHPEWDVDVPVHAKSDPMPYMPQWSQHIFILVHALLPMAAHQVVLSATGWPWLSTAAAFPLYVLGTVATMMRQTHIMRYLGHVHGYLDGDVHARDGIPDVGVRRIFFEMWKMMLGRALMMLLLAYRPGDDSKASSPLASVGDVGWWGYLALHLAVYGVVLDFWFYWYHRAMHDVAPLWRLHRTHHLTKHPNPMLTGYADDEQEIGDIFLIPLLTFVTVRFGLGLPMDFYQLWICQAYILYAEAMGHSGLRVYLHPPSMAVGLLSYFDLALAIEDHDLHHRKGHRKSFNYGKQTRLWDWLFGTMFERYESQNVDYKNKTHMPFF